MPVKWSLAVVGLAVVVVLLAFWAVVMFWPEESGWTGSYYVGNYPSLAWSLVAALVVVAFGGSWALVKGVGSTPLLTLVVIGALGLACLVGLVSASNSSSHFEPAGDWVFSAEEIFAAQIAAVKDDSGERLFVVQIIQPSMVSTVSDSITFPGTCADPNVVWRGDDRLLVRCRDWERTFAISEQGIVLGPG